MSFDLFHLDGEDGFRGGERQLLYLAAALRERGHRNTVVCRAGSSLAQASAVLGLETFPLRCMAEWNILSALRIQMRARKRERPILHSHTGHAVSLGVLAGFPKFIPHVAHRRVDFPLRGWTSAFKYGRADMVVTVSNAIRELLLQDGISADRLKVLPDAIPVGKAECRWAGIPESRFAPPQPEEKARRRRELAAELEISPEAAWVGNLAALAPHKDHDNLLAAAFLVLKKKPDTIFLIAGDGPERYSLAARIRRLGMEDRLFLLGQREPETILKTVDVFVLSSWGEGMGSVLLEAASCGIPIAATTAGGIPENIEDGRTGLLAPPRDPEALAERLLELLANPRRAQNLAEAAKSGLGRYSLTRMAEEMERIYEHASAGR